MKKSAGNKIDSFEKKLNKLSKKSVKSLGEKTKSLFVRLESGLDYMKKLQNEILEIKGVLKEKKKDLKGRLKKLEKSRKELKKAKKTDKKGRKEMPAIVKQTKKVSPLRRTRITAKKPAVVAKPRIVSMKAVTPVSKVRARRTSNKKVTQTPVEVNTKDKASAEKTVS